MFPEQELTKLNIDIGEAKNRETKTHSIQLEQAGKPSAQITLPTMQSRCWRLAFRNRDTRISAGEV